MSHAFLLMPVEVFFFFFQQKMVVEKKKNHSQEISSTPQMVEVKMIPVQHMGPICSLKILSDGLLLAGNGPTLEIYNYVTGEKLFKRIVFKRNKIHGIEFIKNGEAFQLVVWGGRSLSIFTLDQFKDENFELPLLGVGDWIFHCVFQSSTDLYILNSHNVVHHVTLVSDRPKLLETIDCNWKSILYSGTLHLNRDNNKITVLAGTVMNGILVWELETAKVKHNLTLHEGSIFSVNASPDGRYLISCSDDRSIKVWDMESGNLLSNGWGHGSRIWGLTIYNMTADGFNMLSCSEDCTARIWTFKDGADEIKQERIILGHTGRHVWSLAVDDKKMIGFTGGADGKILVTDLNEQGRKGYWGHRWELKDIFRECNYDLEKGELIKEYVDFGYGLYAVTSEGKAMVLKDHKSWSPLFTDSRFEKFCVLKGFESSPICVLGSKLGRVIIMKFNENCEVIQQNEIDLSSHFNRLNNILIHEYDGKYFALFESPNPKHPLVYQEFDPVTLQVLYEVLLEKPDEKVCVSSVEYNKAKEYLLVGCRYATLIVYQIKSAENKPTKVYSHLFKGDTISSLKSLDHEECIFHLTNKDGTYHLMKIHDNLQYEFLQSSRIQKGFLEGVFKIPNGDLIFYGFKSDSFFIWNETKQYEILREICGGPHRRWFFKHWVNESDNRLKYRLIYTRASEVQLVEKGEAEAVETLATGLHGREVRDICIVDAEDENEKVVITGAEDTTLKIGTLKENGDFQLHWTYREHVAGLQSIHAINRNYIITSSAREELFIWKITECDGKKCMSMNASLKPSEKNPDLRIMNFDSIEVFSENTARGCLIVAVYSNSAIKVVYFDFEEKKFSTLIDDAYMQCCIFHVRFVCIGGKLHIMIGSTNGHLTIYDISETTDKYFVAEYEENSVKLRKKPVDVGMQIMKLGKLLINQQIHQSSIRALATTQTSQNEVSIVTGGDDNAIALLRLYKCPGSQTKLDLKSFEASAASSTITTITHVNKNQVLIGAVDQSIKLWNINNGLKLVANKYSTVADIGCSEITHFANGKKYALIGGAGLSIWNL